MSWRTLDLGTIPPVTTSRPVVDPPIADHRLLGNGHSTALVLPDGSIDWWCAPVVDSPPLLWRLLDPAGPIATWVGAQPSGSGRAVAGHGLRTTVSVDGVLVQLLDGVVAVPGGAALGRFVRAVDRPVSLVHHLGVGIAGFDATSGQTRPEWSLVDGTATAIVDGQPVMTTAEDVDLSGGVLRVRIDAVPDRWRGLVIAVGADTEPDPDLIASAIESAMTVEADAIQTCRLPNVLTDVTVDALSVLGACTHVESGAVIASPTTSLPEVIGGDRQFDYRYCWLRDSAQAVSVAAQLGKHGAARELFDFLSDLGPDRLLESPLFTVRGDDVPAEQTMTGVAGWQGSRPVRVGNDAAGQVQHDVLGIVMESITAFDELGDDLTRRDLAIVDAFAERAMVEPGPTSGIWELREPVMVVSADIGRWVALDRAAALAGRHRRLRWVLRSQRWTARAAAVRAQVLDAQRPDGGLPRAYDDDDETHDASALLVVIYGLLTADDSRAHTLVDATLGALSDGPFLRRYCGVDDGFAPGEGAFLPCSWWAVSALAVLGRKDEAQARADAMLAVLPGIQPEEVDVATGVGLGNVPLVWAHTEAARAAVLLDRA